MDWVPIAIISGAVALFVLVIVASVRRERARTEEMRSRASALGFTYREQDEAAADGVSFKKHSVVPW